MDKRVLLGRRIKEIRKRRRLSQEQLAERAGISSQYVSNIERGKENPTLDLLFSLANALKVPLGEMCDLDPIQDMDQKRMQAALREVLRTAGPDGLRVALKVLRAVLR